jgi:mRNA interferase HicA
MKYSELLRMLLREGWVAKSQNGSYIKLLRPVREGLIISPNHGSKEIGKGLKKKIKRIAGL